MSLQSDSALENVGPAASREELLAEINRLRSENVELKEQQRQIYLYIREKVRPTVRGDRYDSLKAGGT